MKKLFVFFFHLIRPLIAVVAGVLMFLFIVRSPPGEKLFQMFFVESPTPIAVGGIVVLNIFAIAPASYPTWYDGGGRSNIRVIFFDLCDLCACCV